MLASLTALTLLIAPASPPREHSSGDSVNTAPPRLTIPTKIPTTIPRASSQPTSRERRAHALGLVPLTDGGYDYQGARGERFDATILRDGAVVFHLDPTVQIKLDGVCLIAVCVTKEIVKKKARRKEYARAALGTALALAAAGIVGASTGSASFGVGRRAATNGIPGSGVLSGETAAMMGAVHGRYGYLPEPVTAMTAFMERTFDLRLELVVAADQARLELALDELPRALLEGWRAADTSAARHAFILQSWRDLDESSLAHRDAVLVTSAAKELETRHHDAAARAREIILDFVGEHAPLGSAHAFRNDELARVNADRGASARFDPYRRSRHRDESHERSSARP